MAPIRAAEEILVELRNELAAQAARCEGARGEYPSLGFVPQIIMLGKIDQADEWLRAVQALNEGLSVLALAREPVRDDLRG